jgi:hypothetical protein
MTCGGIAREKDKVDRSPLGRNDAAVGALAPADAVVGADTAAAGGDAAATNPLGRGAGG